MLTTAKYGRRPGSTNLLFNGLVLGRRDLGISGSVFFVSGSLCRATIITNLTTGGILSFWDSRL